MRKKYLIYSILVAVAYAVAGVLGLKLAVPPGYASAVFPSSGIALAALLLLGPQYCPAIFLGSAAMNLYVASQNGAVTSTSIQIGLLIGLGATLQAFVGARLIKKYIPTFENLSEEKNIIFFLLLAGPFSCVVNATLSITVLSLYGVLSGAGFFYNWGMWYVGDAIGAMVFTPVILAIAERPRFRWSPKKRLLVFPSIVMFSFVVWFFFYSSTQLSDKFVNHLQNESERHARRITEAMGRYEAILSGTERFFVASKFVSREEFHNYLEKTLENDRGIRAISWNPLVKHAELKLFEQKAEADGIVGYHISEIENNVLKPSKQKPFYYPIFYTEPMKSNLSALGFDTFSMLTRREAIEKSIHLKRPVISPQIRIIQDNFKSPSIAMYYPVFENNKNTGIITGVFRLDDLINSAIYDESSAGLNYVIYDITDDSKDLLFKRVVKEEEEIYANEEMIVKNHPRDMFNLHVIEVGQRKWLTQLFPSKQYVAAHADLTAWSMLIGGLVVVILLQSLMMVIIGRTSTVERLVDQKTIELSNANIELEKLTQLKSAFLANMSHEIRTPINGVVGMTALLRDTQMSKQQSEYVDNISTSASSLLGLINDILDFSKVEAGKLDLEMIDFDLEKTIKSTVKTLEFVARRKNLQLEVELVGLPTRVLRGDPGRFSQILINLLNNAVKFTPAGKVKLKASLLNTTQGRNYFRFEVIDTGIGIEASAIDRIFLPFDQADTSTTRKFGGTGLGLSICKHLTELMGGKIGVISSNKQGSTFWFELPFEDGQASLTDLRRKDNVDVNLGNLGLRILLAEDNQINQLVAVKQLQKLGCHCDAVGNGKEAIEALRNISYDLVLMDCQMPELDGYEATRQIRVLNEKFSAIPIIAMTAHAMKGDREKCLEAGMNDYVTKPISISDLANVIETWTKSNTKAA